MSDTDDFPRLHGLTVRLEQDRCLAAVDAEPEFPGPILLRARIPRTRTELADLLKSTVCATKRSIRERIDDGEWEPDEDWQI